MRHFNAPILVAGAKGMVGSALVRRLHGGGYTCVLAPSRHELDLLDQAATNAYLTEHRPHYIFVAAARVGGIQVGRFRIGASQQPRP